MIATVLPPSPALSACDSLADIDDLDAFLMAQGPLSKFATPPPPPPLVMEKKSIVAVIDTVELANTTPPLAKKGATITYVEVFDSDDEFEDEEDDGDRLDYNHITLLFATATCAFAIPAACETQLIHALLLRARLPVEILALAYNIVQRFHAVKPFSASHAADLLTVAALALAVTYTDDHAPRSSWWAWTVCDGLWNARDVDGVVLEVLAAMDWGLHGLCAPEALERGVGLLLAPPVVLAAIAAHGTSGLPSLLLPMEEAEPRWGFGHLTPEDTPPGSPEGEAANRWLRLL
ncbi:hypothetical protein LTR08_004979 [Meristemomyces frigidus]|nr:hypothetical protein LTR08_004979 [Meristemomyces frigidus]